MHGHKLMGGNEKIIMGGIKITVVKKMRDVRHYFDQSKRPMSKEFNRNMCEILYQRKV